MDRAPVSKRHCTVLGRSGLPCPQSTVPTTRVITGGLMAFIITGRKSEDNGQQDRIRDRGAEFTRRSSHFLISSLLDTGYASGGDVVLGHL